MSKAYTLKMRGGCEVDSKGKRAGKGALIQEELAMTLGVSQDQYVFQTVYAIESHPHDCRVKIDERGIVQTLNERMGTGGGNVPLVMQEIISIDRAAFNQGENAKYDFSISGGGYTQTLVARGPNAICYRTDQIESERYVQRTTSGCNKNK